MAEENIWIIESWENWWNLNEWISEQDRQRIQEEARQIKKIAQQIKQDKKANNELADFLTFLLSAISNDNIINALYNTFFITIDPKTNIPYFRKCMNDIVVVWVFYPFFKDEADKIWISHFYEWLKNVWSETIEWYINYLQDLSDHYHDNIPVNQTSFIQLIVEIVKEFLSNAPDSPHSNKDEDWYKNIVYEKLYLE